MKKTTVSLIAVVAITAAMMFAGCVEEEADSKIPEELRYPEATVHEVLESTETEVYVEYWTKDDVSEVVRYYDGLSGWTTAWILEGDEARRAISPIICTGEIASLKIEKGSESCKIVYCGGDIMLLYFLKTPDLNQ